MTRHFLVAKLVVALASAALTGCNPSESSRVPEVHTVVPGLLIRGGQPGKRGLRELRDDFGIRSVVNFNDLTNKSEAKVATELGLNYLPLDDDPFDDEGDHEMLLSFLKVVRNTEQNAPVYVHCKTGVD